MGKQENIFTIFPFGEGCDLFGNLLEICLNFVGNLLEISGTLVQYQLK